MDVFRGHSGLAEQSSVIVYKPTEGRQGDGVRSAEDGETGH